MSVMWLAVTVHELNDVYNSIGSSTEEGLMFLPCSTRMEDIDIGMELYVHFSNDQTI